MNFLTARWHDLLLANYIVDPQCLAPYLPNGTLVDNFDGNTFVSLVAFMFDDARILGVPIPGHRRFEEVNLRFYVTPDHSPETRAVSFIREIVPLKTVALVANKLFKERYVASPMSHVIKRNHAQYSWGTNLENRFSATHMNTPELPISGSITEFITEHYFGYSSGRRSSLEYRVEHPQWRCSDASEYEIALDFGQNYGADFSFLNTQKPYNVIYAEGSRVTASFPKRV